MCRFSYDVCLFTVLLALPYVVGQSESGSCCYMCKGDSCYGCWPDDSYCSEEHETCASVCIGTWVTNPKVEPAEHPGHSLLSTPKEVYKKNLSYIPGTPVIVDNSIYTASGSFVKETSTPPYIGFTNPFAEKRDLATGQRIWGVPLPDRDNRLFISLQPIVASGSVLVQITYSTGPILYALNAEDGSLMYNITLDDSEAATRVAVGSGKIFFMENLETLVALDPHSGNVSWRFSLGGLIISDISSPVTADGLVFKTGVRGSNYYIYAINTTSGFDKWPLSLAFEPWMARLTFGESQLFFSTSYFPDKKREAGEAISILESINPNSGTPTWGKKLSMEGVIKQPGISLGIRGSGPVLTTTTCKTPIYPSAPPVWWMNCELSAIDTSVASKQDMRDAVLWRMRSEENITFSAPIVRNNIAFLSGVTFVNGTWPICNGTYLNCTWPANASFDDIPHYKDPFLMAVRVSDGQLLWRFPVNIGNLTYPLIHALEMLIKVAGIIHIRPQESPDLDSDSLSGIFDSLPPNPPELETGYLPLPWLLLPWTGFEVDESGERLAFATTDGLVVLDVSQRANSGIDDSVWMIPTVIATCGLVFIVLVVVVGKGLLKGDLKYRLN